MSSETSPQKKIDLHKILLIIQVIHGYSESMQTPDLVEARYLN